MASIKQELNQLLRDLNKELAEWEKEENPSEITKALIRERYRFILAIQNILLSNIKG